MTWQSYVTVVPQRNGAQRQMSRQMNSLFDDVFNLDSRLLKTASRAHQNSRSIQLREDGDTLFIEVEAPRFDEKDFEISLAEGTLKLRAERSIEKEVDGKPTKRVLESWSREVALPFEVDETKIDAKLAKGILTITLPKLPQVKPEVKKIAVHS